MNFRKWLESYNPDIIYLKKYMQSRTLDLPNLFYEFITWKGCNTLLKRLKINKDQLEKAHEEGDDWELLDKIEKAMTNEEKSDFIDTLHSNSNSPEAPTWSFFDSPRMLKPSTWLIHFSDDASDISWKGFKYGSDDMTKLGLTTYLSKDAKQYGGYNFAFVADSRDAKNAAGHRSGRGKYGKEAVMFQAAGVQAYHYGDEENQVIFYGKSINPNKVVYLSKADDDWCVNGNRTNRSCLYTGPFEDTIDWVINNHEQYRHKIAGYQRSEL